ncbi:MAG: LysR family transcriptional regulator [Eubacteriales bacterium]
MTLQQLHYVIAITEMGSFNKASEVLYISQPSLTGAVQELEKELGIVIFHRTRKGVTLTNDGLEFINHARQLYQQYEIILDKYEKGGMLKKKFGISTQHYSFAVKSFVEMVKRFNTAEYEFAIRETKTREVIEDVSTSKSEIGILYLNEFNRKIITKLLRTNNLEFHKLIDCKPYVYLWKGHPLSKLKSICFDMLTDYPCLSFEQGDTGSFYFAEEIFSTNVYPRTIKVNDRATMLNLMVGLNGYTLCSGIICEELNGTDYIAVPLEDEGDPSANTMEIGYIVKKDILLSSMSELYIREIDRYLKNSVKETE